jgi:hypothetical protein
LCLVDANCRYESALRVPVCAFVAVAVASASLIAQPPRSDSAVRFDVASVKPSAGSTRYGISRPTNGIVRTRAAELRRLIAYAYGTDPASHEPQPEGGPHWIDKDLFEIEARGPVDMSFADGRRMMQTPVIDGTGLTGTYEVDFVWAPARSGPGGAAAAEVVSIFSALPEQLGLKLQPRRQRKEVVMIDSVSPLIPN